MTEGSCRLVELTANIAVVSVGTDNTILPHKHTDERRTIYEVWTEGIGLLQVLHVLSFTGPLGKHYHRYTKEVFTIARGGGELLSGVVDGEGCQVGDIEYRQLAVGDVISMEVSTAHTFYLEPGSVMTCIASHHYNSEDVIPTPWLVRPD